MKKSRIIIMAVVFLMVAGILTVFALSIPGTKTEGGTKLKEAYIIGISTVKFPVDDEDYLYAAQDAFNMNNYLQNYAGFNQGNTILKTDDMASKLDIERDFMDLDKNQTPKDIFIFYYAGHGDVVPDENAYVICPYDAQENYLNTIKGSSLHTFLSQIKTDKIICIFDCCESGGMIKDITNNNPDSSKYTILTACNIGESAMEMNEVNEGIFTHYLIEGLKGKADDVNKNGRISLEEAFRYAENETIKYGQINGDIQHPQIFDGSPQEVELVPS